MSRFTRHFSERVFALKNLHLGKVWLFDVICSMFTPAFKIRMFSKKLELKILKFGQMAHNFAKTNFLLGFLNLIYQPFSIFFYLFLFCLVRHRFICINKKKIENFHF